MYTNSIPHTQTSFHHRTKMSKPLTHTTTLLRRAALNPLLTATLLYLLTKSPDRLRGLIISRTTGLKNTQRYVQVVKALKWCLAFGLAGALNRRLNVAALNNGRFSNGREKRRWVWGKEVAVVTGGSSGLGELMVRKLAGRGVRVAVLDVSALPRSLEGCKFVFVCPGRDCVELTCVDGRCAHQVLRVRRHGSRSRV